MDDLKLPGSAAGNARYYRSDDWHIDCTPGKAPIITNSQGGKIILDDTIKKVLEIINGKTFEEIEGWQILPPGQTEIFLKVFTRVGILNILATENTEVTESMNHEGTRRIPSLFNFSHEDTRRDTKEKVNPLVSVVIVNYNGDAQLPDLLDSLKRQTYPHREIIVVDNHSTDHSCAWVKANYSEVRLMELKKNTGFAAGANTGIGSASGDLILLLNNDIVLEEDAIDELVRVAISYDRPWAAVAPKMKFFNNPAFINAIGNSFYPYGWGSDNFIGQVDFGQNDHLTESLSACFGAVLLNPQVIKSIGVLDPHYKFYYEDLDWCYRAQMQGFPVINAPKAVIYHKFGASMSLKSQTFKTRFIVGNRLYFSIKNLGRRSLRRFLVNYLFEDMKSTFYYLGKLNFPMIWAYARGYGRFLLSLPGLFYKRRRLQKQRIIKDDGVILAKTAPVDGTIMQNGVPKLDIHSLQTIMGSQ